MGTGFAYFAFPFLLENGIWLTVIGNHKQKVGKAPVFGQTIGWEMSFGQNLRWEMTPTTPFRPSFKQQFIHPAKLRSFIKTSSQLSNKIKITNGRLRRVKCSLGSVRTPRKCADLNKSYY